MPSASALHALVKQRFALDDAATDELIAEAVEAERRRSIFIISPRGSIARSTRPGRARMVEMMWQIVYADGHVSEFEDNLIWRAADLLGVSREERIALRERVSRGKGRRRHDRHICGRSR